MASTSSISTGSIYQFGLNRIFEIVHKAGFENIELMLRPFKDNGYADSWDISYLNSLRKRNNIKITSIHPPIDFETNPKFYFPKVVDLARKLNVRPVIIHIPKNDQTDYIKWFYEFNPKKDCKEIDCLFENMGKESIYQGIDEYAKYLSFCYDIAHAIKAGDSPQKELSNLKNVKQLHISMFDGGHCHKSVLIDKELIKKLISMQTKANRCLELCPEAFPNPGNEVSITNILRDNREIIESAL